MPEEGSKAGFQNIALHKKLDDGQSPKKDVSKSCTIIRALYSWDYDGVLKNSCMFAGKERLSSWKTKVSFAFRVILSGSSSADFVQRLFIIRGYSCYDKWVPVTSVWHILRLQMEERPPIWRVAANILNKQLRTADKGHSSSLGAERGANNSSP